MLYASRLVLSYTIALPVPFCLPHWCFLQNPHQFHNHQPFVAQPVMIWTHFCNPLEGEITWKQVIEIIPLTLASKSSRVCQMLKIRYREMTHSENITLVGLTYTIGHFNCYYCPGAFVVHSSKVETVILNCQFYQCSPTRICPIAVKMSIL